MYAKDVITCLTLTVTQAYRHGYYRLNVGQTFSSCTSLLTATGTLQPPSWNRRFHAACRQMVHAFSIA